MTHYTAATIAIAWAFGRRATADEYLGTKDLRMQEGCGLSACQLALTDVVFSQSAHVDGIRSTCPRCEVLWDEAVGA